MRTLPAKTKSTSPEPEVSELVAEWGPPVGYVIVQKLPQGVRFYGGPHYSGSIKHRDLHGTIYRTVEKAKADWPRFVDGLKGAFLIVPIYAHR